MSRRLALVLLVLAVLVGTAPAPAAEWGTIIPGISTTDTVRARYGQPAKSRTQKVEGYDTTQWIYEGAGAPSGIVRLTVDFGLLTAAGYKKDVVRSFRLDPRPGIFNRKLVVDGWGPPAKVGREGELEVYLYEQGLLVYFDKEGEAVQAMIFTPPQAQPGTPGQR